MTAEAFAPGSPETSSKDLKLVPVVRISVAELALLTEIVPFDVLTVPPSCMAKRRFWNLIASTVTL